MIRRAMLSVTIAVLILLGAVPFRAGSVMPGAMSTMDMQAGGCPDCDQASVPDGNGCYTMSGCSSAPSWTAPGSSSAPVLYPRPVTYQVRDQGSVRAADVLPPFRPPRSSIFA
jgi:hypothetical protein